MSFISDKIANLIKQLLPNGRAFWVPPGGYFEKLNKGLGGDGSNQTGTLEKAYDDAVSILDSILPDNENFTDGTTDPNNNDCNDWERREGLVQYGITSVATPTTADRKLAIATKMNYPGTNRPRMAAAYLESQLHSAGFDVHVYENIFMPGGVTKTPAEILGIPAGSATYGSFDYGMVDYGEEWLTAGITLVANDIDETVDASFAIIPPDGYRSTIFIAGATIDVFADVPEVRKAEFRQQILRLKGGHICAILFINYI